MEQRWLWSLGDVWSGICGCAWGLEHVGAHDALPDRGHATLSGVGILPKNDDWHVPRHPCVVESL